MDRVINFSAGPSTIPLGVLKQAQEELLNYAGLGFSIMEISHRTKIFEEVLHSAMDTAFRMILRFCFYKAERACNSRRCR